MAYPLAWHEIMLHTMTRFITLFPDFNRKSIWNFATFLPFKIKFKWETHIQVAAQKLHHFGSNHVNKYFWAGLMLHMMTQFITLFPDFKRKSIWNFAIFLAFKVNFKYKFKFKKFDCYFGSYQSIFEKIIKWEI